MWSECKVRVLAFTALHEPNRTVEHGILVSGVCVPCHHIQVCPRDVLAHGSDGGVDIYQCWVGHKGQLQWSVGGYYSTGHLHWSVLQGRLRWVWHSHWDVERD